MDTHPKLPITAVVLTFNEALHVERLMQNLAPVEQVVVVDSHSTDNTVEIVKAYGARVLERPFTTYAEQMEWALDAADIRTEWTLRIDADEILEPDLWHNLQTRLAQLDPDICGLRFKRKHIFMGRWVRHGGRYPVTLLRLWRTGTARIEQRFMDEHIYLTLGRSIVMNGGFADVNLKDAAAFTAKHNGYATREAVDVLAQKYDLMAFGNASEALRGQAGTKRKWKERLYNRMPFGVGPLLYFLWRFVFQLGFLDGREGRIYHVLQGFWYRYLVDVRTLEFERAMAGCETKATRRDALARVSGYDLSEFTPREGDTTDRVETRAAGLPE